MRRRLRAGAVALVVLVVACTGGDQDARPTTESQPSAPTPTSEAPAPTGATDPFRSTVGTQPATLDAAVPDAVPEPRTLAIDAIGVDARVAPVGVEPDGGMEVPSAEDVGWYRFGPAPGAAGSAVLAAHVDYDGREGAFFRLEQVRSGTVVEVGLSDGTVRRFVVEDVRRIPKAAIRDAGVFERRGGPRLSLITCGGEFDSDARSYRDNVVVTAVPSE